MARILIIGAGVVGEATGVGFIEHDNDVTFVDVNPVTIEGLRTRGYHAITPEEMNLDGVDAIFVSVTALTSERDGIDLTHLETATQTLGEKLAEIDSTPVIVYRCTLPPGTVRGVLIPLLEKCSGKQVGVDFGVVYNPEFLRAKTALEDFLNPRIVVLASRERNCWEHRVVETILRDFGPTHWLEFEQAELLKYVNNVFNAFKITFFNMMRCVADKQGVTDTDQVFELATMSAEGLWNPLYGTGDDGFFGGVCLPKDTEALRFIAAALGLSGVERLIAAVQDINRLFGGAR